MKSPLCYANAVSSVPSALTYVAFKCVLLVILKHGHVGHSFAYRRTNTIRTGATLDKTVTVVKNDTSSLTTKQHASNRLEMTGSQRPGMFELAYKQN